MAVCAAIGGAGFGGVTLPNTWFTRYALDADIVVHEAMLTADQLRQFYNQPPGRTIMMNTDIHTSAQVFGKVMSMIQPKHAIAHHFLNEEGTRYGIYWPELIKQCLDMTEINKRWLQQYMKEQGLTAADLPGRKK